MLYICLLAFYLNKSYSDHAVHSLDFFSVLRTFALIVYAHPTAHAIHVASCTSARANEEIYSHEGMVSVALTLLRFNSLGWSVTPTFFLDRRFSLLILDRLRKNEQKINVGS